LSCPTGGRESEKKAAVAELVDVLNKETSIDSAVKRTISAAVKSAITDLKLSAHNIGLSEEL